MIHCLPQKISDSEPPPRQSHTTRLVTVVFTVPISASSTPSSPSPCPLLYTSSSSPAYGTPQDSPRSWTVSCRASPCRRIHNSAFSTDDGRLSCSTPPLVRNQHSQFRHQDTEFMPNFMIYFIPSLLLGLLPLGGLIVSDRRNTLHEGMQLPLLRLHHDRALCQISWLPGVS
jgi:hypothetical protein